MNFVESNRREFPPHIQKFAFRLLRFLCEPSHQQKQTRLTVKINVFCLYYVKLYQVLH